MQRGRGAVGYGMVVKPKEITFNPPFPVQIMPAVWSGGLRRQQQMIDVNVHYYYLNYIEV